MNLYGISITFLNDRKLQSSLYIVDAKSLKEAKEKVTQRFSKSKQDSIVSEVICDLSEYESGVFVIAYTTIETKGKIVANISIVAAPSKQRAVMSIWQASEHHIIVDTIAIEQI